MSNYVAAIDIGTTKVVAIVGKENENGKLEVLGVGTAPSSGVIRGEVINIENTVKSVLSAVDFAEHKSGLTLDDVVVGIAGKHIRCTQNRGYIMRESNDTEISKSDVDKLINEMYNMMLQPGEEIIHILPQDFIVDQINKVNDPIGMCGKRLDANFHMVVGKVDSIKYIRKSIEKSNLKIKSIVLEPLASADAVLSEDEKEVGVALVDIGGGTTDLAVYHEGIIRHTAVIPFGGNVITKDIKEWCGILDRQAEEVKKQFGGALQDYALENKFVSIAGIRGREPKEISFKTLAGIIQARMEEIIDAVMFEIEYSGVMDKLGGGIVLTGGGAMLKHLPQLMSFKTGFDIHIGYPTEHIESKYAKELKNTMYATGVGLLLKAVKLRNETETFDGNEELNIENSITSSLNNVAVEEDIIPEDSLEMKESSPKIDEMPKSETNSTKEKDSEKKGVFERWAEKFFGEGGDTRLEEWKDEEKEEK